MIIPHTLYARTFIVRACFRVWNGDCYTLQPTVKRVKLPLPLVMIEFARH